MILVELIIKIREFGTDIILKMGFQRNVLITEIFEMALKSKMAAHLCRFKQYTSDIISDGKFFFMILLSTIHFLAMPDIVVWQKVLQTFHCDSNLIWPLISKVNHYIDIIVDRIRAV